MNKVIKMCMVTVFVLGACTPYDPFELSSGKLTVQEAKGYNSESPYMAITARSKHYQFSDSSSSYLDDGTEYGAHGNGDEVLNPGETVIYYVQAANYGEKPARNVSAVISTSDNYIYDVMNLSGLIGNFSRRGDYTTSSKFVFGGDRRAKNLTFTVSPNTPSGHIVRFEIVFSDIDGNSWQDYFLITVY